MNVAVLMCLDRNKLVERESGPPGMTFYEAEAVQCAQSWREAAGWDGAMYAVQYEGRAVATTTERRLRRLGVEVVTLPPFARARPFMEVVNALAWAEDGGVPEKRIVYSDLDVAMTAPLPAIFSLPGRTVLYKYTGVGQRAPSPEFAYRLRRAEELGVACHNTYFQAFDARGGFQRAVLDAASSAGYWKFFEENVYYAPTDDDYFFEEGAYDYVCSRGGFGVVDLPCPSAGDPAFFEHEHLRAERLAAT